MCDMKRALPLLGLAIGALTLVPAAPMKDIKDLVGKPIGKIEMRTIDGKTLTNKDFQGKVVLFDFWATWCGPCIKASPEMEKIHKEFKNKGVLVIGANAFEEDLGDSYATKYKKEHGYTYLFTYGNDALLEKWNVPGIPTFVLIDQSGKVVKAQTGLSASTAQELRDEIKRLVAKN